MRCSECRDILFSIAEEAADRSVKTEASVDKTGTSVDKTEVAGGKADKVSEGKKPETFLLPAEVQHHIEQCSSCASLAEALRLTSEETALQVDAPAGLAERVAASLIEQPKVVTHSFGLRRAASLAAAAVLLVAVSVSVTLMLSGNGPGGSEAPEAPGGAVAENTMQGSAEQNAVKENAAVGNNEHTAGQKSAAAAQIPEQQQEVVTIHLSLEAPHAESVAVVGDWNGWNPGRHRMTDKNGDGIWELQINVEQGGEYKYQFLINGDKWIPDPNAPLQVEDGFGGTNSILNI